MLVAIGFWILLVAQFGLLDLERKPCCDHRFGERRERQFVDPHQTQAFGVSDVDPLPEAAGADQRAAHLLKGLDRTLVA